MSNADGFVRCICEHPGDNAACPVDHDQIQHEWASSFVENAQRDRLRQALEQLNGWRELGQEMERIVQFMSEAQRYDLLPDWFVPRLKQFLAKPSSTVPPL